MLIFDLPEPMHGATAGRVITWRLTPGGVLVEIEWGESNGIGGLHRHDHLAETPILIPIEGALEAALLAAVAESLGRAAPVIGERMGRALPGQWRPGVARIPEPADDATDGRPVGPRTP